MINIQLTPEELAMIAYLVGMVEYSSFTKQFGLIDEVDIYEKLCYVSEKNNIQIVPDSYIDPTALIKSLENSDYYNVNT